MSTAAISHAELQGSVQVLTRELKVGFLYPTWLHWCLCYSGGVRKWGSETPPDHVGSCFIVLGYSFNESFS